MVRRGQGLFIRLFGKRFIVYTDGALRSDPPATGLGVIVKNRRGEIIHWMSKVTGRLTCNQAEYAALIFGLEEIRKHRPYRVDCYLDSQVVVNQLKGVFAVRSPPLKRLHRKASRLIQAIPQVTLTYVPRERNRLADALANDALDNQKLRR